jgi:hypothetical protein
MSSNSPLVSFRTGHLRETSEVHGRGLRAPRPARCRSANGRPDAIWLMTCALLLLACTLIGLVPCWADLLG